MNLRMLSIVLIAISMCGCHHFPSWAGFNFWGEEYVVEAAPPSPTHRVFVTPQMRGRHPNRIVMVTSGRDAGSYDASQRLVAELASEFRSQGLFDVAAPRDVRMHQHSDNILEGRFSEREIAKIARNYNAGAVVLVRVNELRSHMPLRMSVTLAVVDSNESVIACGVDGVWDLGRPATQQSFENFLNGAGSWAPHERQLSLQSPSSLFKFVASEMANSILHSGY